MENFIVSVWPQAAFKIGKRAFSWNIPHADAGPGSVMTPSVFITQHPKKLIHALESVYVSKQLQQENRWRIICRWAFNAVAWCSQRADKREVNQRDDHFYKSTLDVPIGHNFYKTFFEAIV